MLVIDNFDSFTYNLVQYFGQLGQDIRVYRNDELSAAEALELEPERVIISPGPGAPAQAGNSLEIIDAFAGKAPLLGVCLGHQCIGEYFGGRIVRAERLVHGKTSAIHHEGTDLFKDIENPFEATRYHSLLVQRDSLPDCLEITASTSEDEIMALRHRQMPIWGVQFHPESLATTHGMKILENFIAL